MAVVRLAKEIENLDTEETSRTRTVRRQGRRMHYSNGLLLLSFPTSLPFSERASRRGEEFRWRERFESGGERERVIILINVTGAFW